ncbi:MAG: hypothetical protein ISR91_06770 [Candidatus Delongbacteria bacterium]|nr:hypothetical protein [Candidatus Delongbacteria bacterium]
MRQLPVRVIPPHIRLCQADRDFLLGQTTAGAGVTSRQGWLASTCTLATALNRLQEVPVSSTLVPHSYAVITRGDARQLQLDPPVRGRGDIVEAPTLTLIGPEGRHLTVPVILPLRHLHLLPQDARELQVKAGDFLLAVVPSDRSPHQRSAGRDLILSGVEARIGSETHTELHLDREEANAAGISSGGLVKILKTPPTTTPSVNSYYPPQRLINERDVLEALKRRLKIKITPGMLITPAAQELGKERDVFV